MNYSREISKTKSKEKKAIWRELFVYIKKKYYLCRRLLTKFIKISDFRQ